MNKTLSAGLDGQAKIYISKKCEIFTKKIERSFSDQRYPDEKIILEGMAASGPNSLSILPA